MPSPDVSKRLAAHRRDALKFSALADRSPARAEAFRAKAHWHWSRVDYYEGWLEHYELVLDMWVNGHTAGQIAVRTGSYTGAIHWLLRRARRRGDARAVSRQTVRGPGDASSVCPAGQPTAAPPG